MAADPHAAVGRSPEPSTTTPLTPNQGSASDKERPSARELIAALEFSMGALRSNQDVLLHKVARTPVVKEQLGTNLHAIGVVRDALKEAGHDVN